MEALNNLLHFHSSKPFLYATRDALIVASLTVVVLIVLMILFYLILGQISYVITFEFWLTMLRSFFQALLLAYIWEYAGINARFSSESMRYAKGTILDKYQRRNEAAIAELAASEWKKILETNLPDQCREEFDEIIKPIEENYNRLQAMVRSTREQKVIIRMVESGVSSEEILQHLKERYQTRLTERDIDLLRNLDPSDPDENLNRLHAVPRTIEILGFNEKLIYYLLHNGFTHLRSMPYMNGRTLDTNYLRKKTDLHIEDVGFKIPGRPIGI